MHKLKHNLMAYCLNANLPLTQNTVCITKTNQLMLLRKTLAVYCEHHTTHITGTTNRCFNVKAGGAYSNPYVFELTKRPSNTWTLRKLDQKFLGSSEMWCWRRMEKISRTDRVKNEAQWNLGYMTQGTGRFRRITEGVVQMNMPQKRTSSESAYKYL
jgi:hypothetical protein